MNEEFLSTLDESDKSDVLEQVEFWVASEMSLEDYVDNMLTYGGEHEWSVVANFVAYASDDKNYVDYIETRSANWGYQYMK